ncbi:LacI family transcriptional regulator [Labedella phragmitis]|uniref:LacI family transcriptional regulator n=1 Tax=Labedella phragmitis TaxID=2498849 RepID=A0A444PYJ5_9MICO|nr:LacI family DNA-binding transcriptional regulator [Labedella phragmitis]RWZ52955.1 LacI family transcriptional regulator [Labedella phragmitis]
MTAARRTTLQDVADAAGLSKAATSYALRGMRGSRETQERVRAVAAALGYTVNPVARALASGRSGTVGIAGSLGDMWQQGLTVMLSSALRDIGQSSSIADIDASPERESAALTAFAAQRVDGIITLPAGPSGSYWATVPGDVRVVSIGDSLAARPRSASVLFENEYGVSTALGRLADLGHRSIGVLAPALPTTPGRPAALLAQTVGRALGVRVVVTASPASVAGAAQTAGGILRSQPTVTALFCLSDSIAFGAYRAAREAGLDVPTDLSILGYDDSELASLVSPPLTTFAWDEQAIVDTALGFLSSDDGEWSPRTTTFRPDFVERDSTAPAPART